jgi:hypothetical protein
MNYQKIDALLSDALDDEPLTNKPNFIVFIRTVAPPDVEQIEELKRLGVKDASAQRNIFSAQISSRAISDLSDKSWIRLLSLSQKLKLLI